MLSLHKKTLNPYYNYAHFLNDYQFHILGLTAIMTQANEKNCYFSNPKWQIIFRSNL